MKFKNIIGIDIGKETIELTVLENGEKKLHLQIENTMKKLNTFFKSLKLEWKDSLFCMEHTGIYNHHLLEVLHQSQANVWLENAIQIKRSIGLTRGKSDKLDAMRIAQYAYLHQERAKLWQPERKVIECLKLLIAQRSRLIKAKKLLQAPLNEGKGFITKDDTKILKQASNTSLKAIQKDLKAVTEKLKQTIESDSRLNELFNYVTSVSNIGTIIGAAVIASTNEFKKISVAKKFACHCGIAPFEYSSGKSIRGKTRVSHMADKDMKTLLHLAALSAASRPGELRDYFERKVAEGKNKMLVLNAIRNKLILRIFACVNNTRKYIKKDLTFA